MVFCPWQNTNNSAGKRLPGFIPVLCATVAKQGTGNIATLVISGLTEKGGMR
jgi:hypothetical protein